MSRRACASRRRSRSIATPTRRQRGRRHETIGIDRIVIDGAEWRRRVGEHGVLARRVGVRRQREPAELPASVESARQSRIVLSSGRRRLHDRSRQSTRATLPFRSDLQRARPTVRAVDRRGREHARRSRVGVRTSSEAAAAIRASDIARRRPADGRDVGSPDRGGGVADGSVEDRGGARRGRGATGDRPSSLRRSSPTQASSPRIHATSCALSSGSSVLRYRSEPPGRDPRLVERLGVGTEPRARDRSRSGGTHPRRCVRERGRGSTAWVRREEGHHSVAPRRRRGPPRSSNDPSATLPRRSGRPTSRPSAGRRRAISLPARSGGTWVLDADPRSTRRGRRRPRSEMTMPDRRPRTGAAASRRRRPREQPSPHDGSGERSQPRRGNRAEPDACTSDRTTSAVRFDGIASLRVHRSSDPSDALR